MVVDSVKIDSAGKEHGVDLPEADTLATRYGKRCTVRAKNDGTLFSPKNRDHKGGLTKRDAQRGRFVFDFRRCSQKCFDLYVQFLKSKNVAFLTRAQRELQNGQ